MLPGSTHLVRGRGKKVLQAPVNVVDHDSAPLLGSRPHETLGRISPDFLYAIMPRDFHREAIAKFLIPDQPQEDNYLDHDEFEEKEKEWEENRDLALAQRTAWVERAQVAESNSDA